MKKYYTPEKEEFHPGFEFEYRSSVHSDKWIKKTYELDKNLIATDESIYHIAFGLISNLIRVKYLDKKDIESLGWKQGKGNWFILGEFSLAYGEPIIDHGLIITKSKKSEDKGFIHCFRGIIKNKSEFKKLLKQVKAAEK